MSGQLFPSRRYRVECCCCKKQLSRTHGSFYLQIKTVPCVELKIHYISIKLMLITSNVLSRRCNFYISEMKIFFRLCDSILSQIKCENFKARFFLFNFRAVQRETSMTNIKISRSFHDISSTSLWDDMKRNEKLPPSIHVNQKTFHSMRYYFFFWGATCGR